MARGLKLIRLSCGLLCLGVVCMAVSGCGSSSPPPPGPSSGDEVRSLPGYSGQLRSKQYAGYVPVSSDPNDTTNQLFYYFVKAEDFNDDTPTLIWLNGGPGASSLMGFFAENLGPQVIAGDGSIVENPHRLSKKFNLMAIDNPVGSGFSYTKNGAYVKSEEEMREQFVQGLRNFFLLHPELLKHPLWVTGESYAGKYIPNIVHELHTQIASDRQSKGKLADLTLKGMIIGNGLYNATASYPTIGDLAYGAGVIDDKTLASVNINATKCLQKIQEQSKSAGDYCENVTVRWLYNDVVHMPMYYDLGLTDSNLDSITSSMGSWLNRDDVRVALHVSGHTWVNNDEVGPVAEALLGDFAIPSAPLVAEAAENGYRVALYNGVRDGSVCNHLGNHQSLLEMDKAWKFKGQYANANDVPMWFQSGSKARRVAGFHKIVENFSFTKLLNTGHLVPTVIPDEFAAFIDWVTHPTTSAPEPHVLAV